MTDNEDKGFEELPPYAPPPQRDWTPAPWTKWGRKPPDTDPIVLPFSWVTEEVSAALDRVTTGDVTKRRRTILMMADAVASNSRDIKEVIQDPTTVGHSAWYQRMKNDPVIQEVYGLCLQTARHWYDQLEGQRMLKRAAVVEQARDNLIDLTGMAIDVLADMLGNPNTVDTVRRQLIVDVLDRADEETGAKTTHVVKTSSGPSMRELAEQRRRRPDRSVALQGQPAVSAGPGARLVVARQIQDLDEVGDLDLLSEDLVIEAEIETVEEDGTVGD